LAEPIDLRLGCTQTALSRPTAVMSLSTRSSQ
jgi:hypothetical protein